MKITAVVMAGGSGERFWPLSKKNRPKQFLPILGDQSMIHQTVERLKDLMRPEDIHIVTLQEYKPLVMEQLPQIDEDKILVEPCGKDTSAAVGLAAVKISRSDPSTVMVMLPSDHYIADTGRFLSTLKAAAEAASGGVYAVTLGIPPMRPETGYGYILKGEPYSEINGLKVHRAAGFAEKPSYDKAVEYVKSGDYFWNSGIFVWRVDLLLRLISIHLPKMYAGLKAIETAPEDAREGVTKLVYATFPKISVDYGILERARDILVIRGDFGWDDVGSWTSLERIDRSKKEDGSIVRARGAFLDTSDNIIISPHRVVAAMGVSGLIVVDDGQNLLICSKDSAQEIKKLIFSLQKAGLEESV
ncbi:MAG: mannose-1-phosphate guanylyltransferase [Bacillota bacterium]